MHIVFYLMMLSSTFIFYEILDLNTRDKIQLIVSGVRSATSSSDGYAGSVEHLANAWAGSDRVISFSAKSYDAKIPESFGEEHKYSPTPDLNIVPDGNRLRIDRVGRAYQASFKISYMYEDLIFYFLYDRTLDLFLVLFYTLFVIGFIYIQERRVIKFGDEQRIRGMESPVSSAHDMRSAILKLELFENSSEVEFRKYVKQQVQYIEQVVNKVIHFSAFKPEESDFNEIDFEKLIIETSRSLEKQYDEKDLKIFLSAKIFRSYNLHINRIVYNILSNAFKYSKSYVKIRSRFYKKRNKTFLRFEVSNDYDLESADNSKNTRSKNLDLAAFGFLSRFSSSNIKDSTGIGLFSAKNDVDSLNGAIRINRSDFYFTIVLDIPVEKCVSISGTERPNLSSRENAMPIENRSYCFNKLKNVAIVDDEKKYREMISKVFTDRGIGVEVFKDDIELQDGLEDMEGKKSFDFVILDRNIRSKDVLRKDPESGLDTIEKMRIDYPSLPAVILHSSSYYIPDSKINDRKTCFLRKDNGLKVENYTSVLKEKLNIEFKDEAIQN